MDNLWPDDILPKEKIVTPSAILKEQGIILGEKTKNTIIGEVSKVMNESVNTSFRREFNYVFNIKCPPLDYTYSMFMINYDIEIYPLLLSHIDKSISTELFKSESTTFVVKSEEEFKNILRKIFRSKKVTHILLAIQAQIYDDSTLAGLFDDN
jgi:hypothetical protein